MILAYVPNILAFLLQICFSYELRFQRSKTLAGVKDILHLFQEMTYRQIGTNPFLETISNFDR